VNACAPINGWGVLVRQKEDLHTGIIGRMKEEGRRKKWAFHVPRSAFHVPRSAFGAAGKGPIGIICPIGLIGIRTPNAERRATTETRWE
jgi:hypothetical protein